MPAKNFRKRAHDEDENAPSEDEEDRRLVLEEVKFLQRLRERKPGIPAFSTAANVAVGRGVTTPRSRGDKSGAEGDEKDDLVLQDTFAQETAVTIEDPNMVKYVEQELAKRRGKNIDAAEREDHDPMEELYVIPENLKVKKRNSEESSTQWTTGIAEVQLPLEYKLKNIEETEAAKKLLQEKRLSAKAKSDIIIPSSYSADYFQRGRDFAEKLRKDHPELYKDRGAQADRERSKTTEGTNKDPSGQRQAATDEFMLDRFRKRERHRLMRR